MSKKKGYRIVFLVVFILALFFETLLFLATQVDNIKKLIENDFRIVLVTAKNKDIKAIKDSLAKIKGVKNIYYIPADETLQKIKSSDKELYASLANVGHSAVPDIIELEVDYTILSKIENFIDEVIKIDGIIDIKYKMLEAYALTHFSFYSNFISVVFSISYFVFAFLIVMGIMHCGIKNFFSSIRDSFKWFGAGFLGGLFAVVFFYFIVYPVKYLTPVWQWPSIFNHIAIVISCGLIGWVLHQWKNF